MIIREIYMKQIRDYMNTPVIKVITGMRRSGKSALLELTRDELKHNGVPNENIIYINFESLIYYRVKCKITIGRTCHTTCRTLCRNTCVSVIVF